VVNKKGATKEWAEGLNGQLAGMPARRHGKSARRIVNCGTCLPWYFYFL